MLHRHVCNTTRRDTLVRLADRTTLPFAAHEEARYQRLVRRFCRWLDRFPAWADFVKGVENDTLPEFGASLENSVKQASEWLGGAAEAGQGILR